jgi:hypothetical protein
MPHPTKVLQDLGKWEPYKDKSGRVRMKTNVRCKKCGKLRTVDKRNYIKALKKGNWTGLCLKCKFEGKESNKWKGGLITKSDGYRLIWVSENDPFSSMRDVRGYTYEHRYVIARKIGRPLSPEELVHHLNGVKGDNRPENLELVNQTEHRLITILEKRIRELEAQVTYFKRER